MKFLYIFQVRPNLKNGNELGAKQMSASHPKNNILFYRKQKIYKRGKTIAQRLCILNKQCKYQLLFPTE